MRSLKTAALVSLAATAVIGLTATGVTAGNVVARALSVPAPIVAYVNIEQVLLGLDESKAMDAQLTAKANAFQKTIDDMNDIKNSKIADIELLLEADRGAELDKLRVLQIRIEMESQIANSALDQLRGELLADIYNKIKASSKKLAEQNGYTMVLSKDPAIQIPRGASSDQVSKVVMQNGQLYINQDHDITQELITYMNNQ